ncbi:MAG: SDR family NAD(P)-dependent oxidoreductase [Saprospiraceae bacterium]|nr:SDR family NAD(P)-dependent oxidoreductase [Saprospiraceae bacterium]
MTEQNTTYILAYHPSNGEEFGTLETAFAHAGFHLLPLKVDENAEIGDFSRWMSQKSEPVILLISDNLLKSVEAMYQMAGVWSFMRKSGKNVAMIASGRKLDPETGEVLLQKTDFSRMSGVIRYINWWQDKYLDERAVNGNHDLNDSEKEERLKAIKAISTEIGDFLKMIKEDNPIDYQEVIDSNLVAYFERIGNDKFLKAYWQHAADEAEVEQILAKELEEISAAENATDTTPLSVNDILLEARRLASVKGLEAALAYLENYYINPDYQEEVGFLFLLYATKSGAKREVMLRELESFLGKYPEESKSHYLAGELHELEGHFETAIHHYKTALGLDEQLIQIHYRLANCYMKLGKGKNKKAKKALKKSIKANPNHIDSIYRLGTIYLEENAFEKAIRSFEKVIDLQPGHAFAHYDLAVTYYKMGYFENAKSYYKDAIALNNELQTEENDLAFGITEKATIIEEKGKEINEEEILEQGSAEMEIKVGGIHPTDAKIVLITGATSGIGRATAYKFAQNGYNLILTGRRIDRLESIRLLIKAEFDIPVYLLNFDVRDLDQTQEALSSLPEAWSKVDILVNNAGLAKGLSPIQEGDFDHWNTMIDTNIKGLLYMTRLISPGMVSRNSGQIINVCSTAGKEVYPNGNVYCATKHAVDALTKAMRIDLVKYNIKVGQVSPGHVEETEFAKVRFDGDEERARIYEDFLPLTSKDVADAIYFMATRPKHVNIQDVLMTGTQQANSTTIHRSGRQALEDQ